MSGAVAPRVAREHRESAPILHDTMHRFLATSALLSLLAASPLVAQQKAAKASPTATELVRLENQWTAGLVKRDRAIFEKLLAPRFVYT